MNPAPPKVLWIDEDQGDFDWLTRVIARCGAIVQPAFSVEEGLNTLKECRPPAILLDIIVRSALEERTRERFSGLRVWRALDPALRARTLVLSIVPYAQLLEEQKDIPPEQLIPKLKLDQKSQLQNFETRLRAILLQGDS